MRNQASNVIKNRPQHKCFLMNVGKSLRALILKIICERLLLLLDVFCEDLSILVMRMLHLAYQKTLYDCSWSISLLQLYLGLWNISKLCAAKAIYKKMIWGRGCKSVSHEILWKKNYSVFETFNIFQSIYGSDQGSTITIKLSYVIRYVWQNFGVVIYVGKYQRAYIRWNTIYMVIFLTIFPKLVLI